MSTIAPIAGHQALDDLANAIRDIVARGLPAERTAALVADALAPFLGRGDLLAEAHRLGDPDRYRQHVLHVEDDGSFSIVNLVWLPGQRTPIHDHVSWCVVGVYEGEETEVRYRVVTDHGPRYLVASETVLNPAHSCCGFAPPGDIHRVWNSGRDKTISIHVYGADIGRMGSSIRRRYTEPVRDASSGGR